MHFGIFIFQSEKRQRERGERVGENRERENGYFLKWIQGRNYKKQWDFYSNWFWFDETPPQNRHTRFSWHISKNLNPFMLTVNDGRGF